MNRRNVFVPMALFAVLTALLAVGLRRDPHAIPSPLVDQPAPAFRLPTLAPGSMAFEPASLRGRVWILNVWASWCRSCREEHPVLLDFASARHVPLVGLDYKDAPDAARAWLDRLGNPYDTIALDADGRVGIDYGVYGVPETFVVDRRGVIVHKHVGPITADVLAHEIRPLLERLDS